MTRAVKTAEPAAADAFPKPGLRKPEAFAPKPGGVRQVLRRRPDPRCQNQGLFMTI